MVHCIRRDVVSTRPCRRNRSRESAPPGEVLEEELPDHAHARNVAQRTVGDEVEDVGGKLLGGGTQPGAEAHRRQAEVGEAWFGET